MIDKPDTDGEKLVASKRAPQRAGGQQTRDAILTAAAELLEQVGFERLSSNMICRHAGMTPPALYRYYPNKYAVLFELAHALLVHQRGHLRAWLASDGFGWATPDEGHARVARLIDGFGRVAQQMTGGAWVLRALNAVPALQEVRDVAYRVMQQDIEQALAEVGIGSSVDRGLLAQTLDALIRLAAEEPERRPAQERAPLRREMVRAVVAYVEAARSPARG